MKQREAKGDQLNKALKKTQLRGIVRVHMWKHANHGYRQYLCAREWRCLSPALLPLRLFKNKDTKQTHKDHQLKLITHLNLKMTVTKKNAQVIWDKCNEEREDLDGKFKYHFKNWQLCPLPCLTPLIPLPLHLSRTVLCSLFQSMLLFCFFPRSCFIRLLAHAIITLHPYSSPPSHRLAVRVTPSGQMSLFLSLDSGAVLFQRTGTLRY